MTTTLTPPPATSPKPAPAYTRFVSVRANLMPDEVLSKRQTEVVRKQVLCGLVIVVGLLLAWFGLSWWQTSSANGDLHSAQHQHLSLLGQERQFAPLVNAQTQTLTIQTELQKLMVGDVSWKDMLATLRTKAPSGITLTNLTGSVAIGGTPNSTVANPGAALNQSGKQQVGQLSVTGSAPSKSAVAAYADRLGTVPGLTAPLITSVTSTTGHGLTFTVDVLITADALGGRYSAASAAPHTGGH
jgi:Tfp pilus assembly protein PilN